VIGDVLHMAGQGDAGEHRGLGFGELWEADVGNVHDPRLLCGSSWLAESLLSWGGRKMGVSLDACGCWMDGGASCFLSQLLPC